MDDAFFESFYMNINALVVTYNRKELLVECIKALELQTLTPSRILVINNASTDGTVGFIKKSNLLENSKITLINLDENIGGAGGFSTGMKYAFDNGADYVWMMDDDAMPHPKALENLMKYATSKHIYGSLAINGEYTAWKTYLISENRSVNLKEEVPEISEVQSLPFLGFLTSKEIYKSIKLPDTSYFIAADDTEYCMRAQENGFKIFICGNSYIDHPKAEYQEFNVLGRTINYVSLPPWKRYYDTRNRIFIAKKYFGIRLYLLTLPSIFFRLLISLTIEKNKYQQLKAYFFGVYDGLLKKGGKRHEQRGFI
ncbi:glycosyltransferase [Acinetobacter bouvetii]|uniref:Glycosyltransferase n=2 Tax=Acinetobacter bouvetii TaxID=202951 RepID=A0A4Q7B3I0_9GAMM|nr:glycosyltransferase [Acinetobacter bouvetii]